MLQRWKVQIISERRARHWGWQVQMDGTGSPSTWADKSSSPQGIFISPLFGKFVDVIRWQEECLFQVNNLPEGAFLHVGSYVCSPGWGSRTKVEKTLQVFKEGHPPKSFHPDRCIFYPVARTSLGRTCWTEVQDTLSHFSTIFALAVLSLTLMWIISLLWRGTLF